MSQVNIARHELLRANPRELRQRLVQGHPVDPRALEGWTYRGTSLGLPRAVEKLTWKTFQKSFWRDPTSGRLLGWNVRLHQDGVEAPSRPKTRKDGAPVATWFYEVTSPAEVALPRAWPQGFDRGLIIDYARAPNPALDTVRFVKDPLVALSPGNSDVLLGVSTVTLPGLCVEIPTWFLLEREAPITWVPPTVRAAAAPRPALWAWERRRAQALFDALLGVGGPEGPPAASAEAQARFWRTLDGAAPPALRLGLRASVHALNLLPLLRRGFGRTFLALSPDARARCLEELEHSPRYAVRQSVATLKILACFAYFEDDEARARLGGAAP